MKRLIFLIPILLAGGCASNLNTAASIIAKMPPETCSYTDSTGHVVSLQGPDCQKIIEQEMAAQSIAACSSAGANAPSCYLAIVAVRAGGGARTSSQDYRLAFLQAAMGYDNSTKNVLIAGGFALAGLGLSQGFSTIRNGQMWDGISSLGAVRNPSSSTYNFTPAAGGSVGSPIINYGGYADNGSTATAASGAASAFANTGDGMLNTGFTDRTVSSPGMLFQPSAPNGSGTNSGGGGSVTFAPGGSLNPNLTGSGTSTTPGG
jgi:hypothetical protein